MTALAVGLGAAFIVSLAAAVIMQRRSAGQRDEFRASRDRLEQRLSVAEVRRHESERRAESANQELLAMRNAMGLDGPRPVLSTQLNELARGASLSTACVADADGLPHAGVGSLDDVDMLSALGGLLASVLPRGATLTARDEGGTELGARALDIGGHRRVLMVEGPGSLPRRAFEQTVLRLDPNAPSLEPLADATFPNQRALTPLVAQSSIGAAMRLSDGAGVIEDAHCGSLLSRHVALLEAVYDWMSVYQVQAPACVQLTDAHGTAALLAAGETRVAVATRVESIDVLTEQRLSGLIRRRLTEPKERAA